MYDFSTETATFPEAAEVVTYFSVANNTSVAQTAYRNIGDVAEQAVSDGAYFRESQLFLIPSAQFGQILPMMPGDQITDGNSGLYKVQTVGGGWNGSAWKLSALRLGIQDFGKSVKYVRVNSTSSDATARIVHETLGDLILCAIQPQVRSLTDIFDVKATPQTYKIWLSETLGQAIQAGDMFQDQDGDRFEILDVSDRKRIDELAVFDCIKKL
jgi:hypothetical protein